MPFSSGTPSGSGGVFHSVTGVGVHHGTSVSEPYRKPSAAEGQDQDQMQEQEQSETKDKSLKDKIKEALGKDSGKKDSGDS